MERSRRTAAPSNNSRKCGGSTRSPSAKPCTTVSSCRCRCPSLRHCPDGVVHTSRARSIRRSAWMPRSAPRTGSRAWLRLPPWVRCASSDQGSLAAWRRRATSSRPRPLYLCGKHGKTVTLHLVPATTVWIDGDGRLLQARVSEYNKGGPVQVPAGPSGSGGSTVTVPSSITVSMLTFSGLGAPVHVEAPSINGTGGGGFSLALIQSKARTTPCTR